MFSLSPTTLLNIPFLEQLRFGTPLIECALFATKGPHKQGLKFGWSFCYLLWLLYSLYLESLHYDQYVCSKNKGFISIEKVIPCFVLSTLQKVVRISAFFLLLKMLHRLIFPTQVASICWNI